jgi:3-hydroxybutyrate dehydrogenase
VLEAGLGREEGRVDVLVSNAGVQIIKRGIDLPFADWKRLLAAKSGSIIYTRSVHLTEASVRKAPYITAKHGILGPRRAVAKEGAACNVRASLVCPGFVRTPLVDQQVLRRRVFDRERSRNAAGDRTSCARREPGA